MMRSPTRRLPPHLQVDTIFGCSGISLVAHHIQIICSNGYDENHKYNARRKFNLTEDNRSMGSWVDPEPGA